MATIVCGNGQCKYAGKSGFCKQDFLLLNQWGQCSIWYFPNGKPRPTPYYNDDNIPDAGKEAFPHDESTDGAISSSEGKISEISLEKNTDFREETGDSDIQDGLRSES